LGAAIVLFGAACVAMAYAPHAPVFALAFLALAALVPEMP
jgi:hypothetical protein